MCHYAELRLKSSVQVPVSPKKDIVYSKRRKLDLVSLSYRLIDENTDMEQDLAYVPPRSSTQSISKDH